MKGHIARYDKKNGAGYIISGKDTYVFLRDEWKSEFEPYVGSNVEFNFDENGVTGVTLIGNYKGPQGDPVKSKMVAGFLSVFLGALGVSRFYLGYYKVGVVQIIMTIVTKGFVGFVWGLMDALLIFSGRLDKDAKRRPLK
ncbi:MAG: TM2 domain-containing protein [Gammaproteobacteria bacterium]